MNLGKQAADLCSSSLTQLFVAAYFADGRWQDYVQSLRELYRRRRDVMLDALAEHFPRGGDVDAARRAACSSGRRCPTTSTRPTCWRGRCATTSRSCPGRAAFLDGRGGSSMRLNFSGVDEDDDPRGRAAHRRGRRASRSSSTGRSPARRAGAAAPRPPSRRGRLADVLELPRASSAARRRG